MGNVETRCSRPLTSRSSAVCPRVERRLSKRAWQSSQPQLPVVRDVRAVQGRARENMHLQKSCERTRPRRRTRRAGGQRSSRRFRTSMNTCSAESAGQRREARHPNLERALVVVSFDGKHPGLGKIGALTCTGRKGSDGRYPGARRSALSSARVLEGQIRPSRRQPTKLRRSHPRSAPARKNVVANLPEAGNVPSSTEPLEAG
jgi:hypothetical protein